MRNIWRKGLLLAALFAVHPAWAEDAKPANPDPFEKLNRKVFRFNDAADRWVLKPVAKGYRAVTPQFVDDGISNFFNNLGEPITILNQALQGKFKLAASDTGRFLLNTTVGLAGFVDVAKRVPLERHDEDFGQTLGVWGMKQGPYLMLPFFGPSTGRDFSGRVVDTFANPRRYYLEEGPDLVLFTLDVIDTRADLLPVEGIIQGDRYLFIRDLYLQKRDFDVHDGAVKDEFLDSMDDDASGDQPASTAGEGGGSTSGPAPADGVTAEPASAGTAGSAVAPATPEAPAGSDSF